MEKRLWCPNGEQIFTYNFTSALTLRQRNVRIHAFFIHALFLTITGKSIEDLIAGSGNDVIIEIGHPIIKAVVAKVVENIKSFFHEVAVEELALDE